MQACLLELSQYHFPNVALDQLQKHPYYNYTQMYYTLSSHLQFFKGFLNPSTELKAKIYRAIHLANAKQSLSTDDFIIFTSEDGLIIKCKEVLNEAFNSCFEQHLNEPDSCVFIPEGCQQLNKYEFPYYRKLLLLFAQNLPQIKASVLTFSGNNPDFLFLCCEVSPDLDLAELWQEYLNGGLLRKHTFKLNELASALQVFDWKYRHAFEITSDHEVTMVVKCTSLETWQTKLQQITPATEDYSLLQLKVPIYTPQEAFGILRILQAANLDVSSVMPLVGTDHMLVLTAQLNQVEQILNQTSSRTDLPSGVEIFTQMPFDQMNLWAQHGLIKAPSEQHYSFLHLIEYNSNTDPLTRQEYTSDFKQSLEQIMQETQGIFMQAFPPIKFDPQLITTQKDGFVVCQMECFAQKYTFWHIPDLRDTQYASITMQAIQILVVKWTDRSLFKGYHSESCMDLMLVFHPLAYYLFKKHTWPEQPDQQAQQLQEQLEILASVR